MSTSKSSVAIICYLPGQAKDLSAPRLNALNAELNPICHQLELLGAHHILHVSRI